MRSPIFGTLNVCGLAMLPFIVPRRRRTVCKVDHQTLGALAEA
jgi:hypothetical protein